MTHRSNRRSARRMTRTNRFFRLLMRLRCPEPIYYWLLDRLSDNDGWRPLFYRERR